MNSFFNFQLDKKSFLDDVPLTYKVTNVVRNAKKIGNLLPPWMTFDPNTLRFYGTPYLADLNTTYNITMEADNGFFNVQESFSFDLIDRAPTLKVEFNSSSIQEEFNKLYSNP